MSGTIRNPREAWEEHIVRDPKICHGEPTFRGTRVLLRTVLASLAAGDSIEEIIADFPSLKPEDLTAAIAFAAASAVDDMPVLGIPSIYSANEAKVG